MQLNCIAQVAFRVALMGGAMTTSGMSSCSQNAIQQVEQVEETVDDQAKEMALRNLERSIALVDITIEKQFDPQTFEMRRFYNPFTQVKSGERASVWMYTAGIEAVNAIIGGLKKAQQAGDNTLYEQHYTRYVQLLNKLYEEADYYLGSFELVSYTQTKSWSVYAVDRVNQKGQANVSGILNVYDDQMWLIRELLESHHLTGNAAYLEKAEYLTEYVLDGWDTTLDDQGIENGGIPWGPGYTTKHACSNGPLITPLVWLHELYKDKSDQVERRYIDAADRETRRTEMVKKADYYLDYAKKTYGWQKSHLLNSNGVYSDMMGGCVPNCDIQYETIGGVRYRSNTPLRDAVGEAFTYNSGTMISGGADLYRATGEESYARDVRALSQASFSQFASLGRDVPQYHSFGTDGFKNWFNGILLRGYQESTNLNEQNAAYLQAFQRNLDYGFERFNQNGYLPTNLLTGWAGERDGQGVEGMFMFTYAAQYALLGQHHLSATD
ncbi:glycoside hydrolase family 76 protein [Sphingobacterium sp. lm-10]|uniref:glycoside hydrolase family 76 protein n=1 Tax=Sphingobacterium sp. lm-10 TaxID=2944904 RepID=UPI0020205BEA|nr:glycoside hydrolase family 76 protein [Sphingobacterium sp. lm-10]MCL7987242.1 glycoside hydrolase family 76 protein [Sphingobacterium sp. lm-10]